MLRVAASGIERLRRVARVGSEPIVTLRDINLPRMAGLTLLREIKQHWPRTEGGYGDRR